MGEHGSLVSVVSCDTYDLPAVRRKLLASLEPFGGIRRFVQPGMRVLLKPNLLAAVAPERYVNTHPVVVQAIAELVKEAGGEVLIGDSPGGPVEVSAQVWRVSAMSEVAERTGARLVQFDTVVWRRVNNTDYLIARPVFEADLVINLPKLKTHSLVLYTGAIKNMFGAIPGTRKRELHVQAPGIAAFSRILVDIFELARPGLTIMDGVIGLEGNGPGTSGRPRQYGCLVAATDAVALDAVVAEALGYRPGQVKHIALAAARGLGIAARERIQVVGEQKALEFGNVELPTALWYPEIPPSITRTLQRVLRLKPIFSPSSCTGCGRCAEVCPKQALRRGRPPTVDLNICVGCMCCAEVCPQGAIAPYRNWLARWIGLRD